MPVDWYKITPMVFLRDPMLVVLFLVWQILQLPTMVMINHLLVLIEELLLMLRDLYHQTMVAQVEYLLLRS